AFPYRGAYRTGVHAALMKTAHPIDRYLARYPGVATLAYGLGRVGFVFLAWSALADLYQRYADYAAAGELLDQIEGRRPMPASPSARGGGAPAGSALLGARTVTAAR